jgi:hypothetical protein
MLFRSKPFYAVSVGKLVVFNSIWEYETNDKHTIDMLMKISKIQAVWQEVKETKKEEKIVEPTKVEEAIAPEEETLDSLRKLYYQKYKKKAFGAWDKETIKSKL